MDNLWRRAFVLAQWVDGNAYDVLRVLRALGVTIDDGGECLTLSPPTGMSRAAMVAMMSEDAAMIRALLVSAHPANDKADGELNAPLPQCVIDQCKGLYHNGR